MKISLVEYGSGIKLDNLFVENVTIQNLKVLLDRANIVIQRSLKTNKRVLEISDGKLRALGIAGAIRLSKEIEIEIVPFNCSMIPKMEIGRNHFFYLRRFQSMEILLQLNIFILAQHIKIHFTILPEEYLHGSI